ncbi:hypothetical protein [Streptomyces cremeus]|uniref:Uncharacterized protein n=1 Tax=Streptomyces cremeus TaxID=66881 RepID=A0ABV5PKV5_STRCM
MSNRRPGILGAGKPVDGGGVATDTLLSHITGFVLQEQPEEEFPGAATPPVTAELRARFPLVMEQMPRLGQDEKFRRSVRPLCTAFRTLASG